MILDFLFLFRSITRNAVHKSDWLLSLVIEEEIYTKGKKEGGGEFRADMILLSIFQPISILLPTSPYRFLGPFLWKLAVISIHTFPFILFIDDSRFPWANIGSRKGRIGRIFSISRRKLVENGYKTSVPNEKGKEIRRWSINPDGKFGYSKMCGDWR